MRALILGLFSACLWLPASAQDLISTPNAVAFGSRATLRNLHLSPDGQKLSFLQTHPEGFSVVRTLDFVTGELSLVGTGNAEGFDIIWCDWANAERLLCALLATDEFSHDSYPVTRLLAINADGGNPQVLLRQLNVAASQTIDRVIDWLADDPEHVLIEATEPRFREIDIYSGYSERVGNTLREQSITPDFEGNLYTDGSGMVRLLARTTNKFNIRWYTRRSSELDWELFRETQIGDVDGRYFPVGFGNNRDELYYVEERDDLDSLRVMNTADGTERLEFEHPRIEVAVRRYVGKYRRLVGVGFTDELTRLHIVDDDVRSIEQRISAQFPGEPVSVIDEDWSRRYYVVLIGGHARAGTYFRFDASADTINEISPAFAKLADIALAPVTRIRYTARDGKAVPAYLTSNATEAGSAQPIVVLVQSEPLAQYGLAVNTDVWGFDFLAQFLAAEGYTVLQANFRGLGGYVLEESDVGSFRGWRQAIDDIADATRYLIEQDIADPDRVCVIGWGAGGYASLMSGIENAELFRCVASIAGVSDPGEYSRYLDSTTPAGGVESFIGRGRDVTEGWAPAGRAKEMGVPVLLFHAENDFIVPARQSEDMYRALKRADKQALLIEYPDAEHGIVLERERIDMLARLARFLGEQTQSEN